MTVRRVEDGDEDEDGDGGVRRGEEGRVGVTSGKGKESCCC